MTASPAENPSDAPLRPRCGACGNLTRFDVEARRHTRAYHHYSLGGEPTVEEEEVLAEETLAITCRWCGRSDAIEMVPRVPAE